MASWRDLKLPRDPHPFEDSVTESIAWLCRAQDASRDGGVSYGFDLKCGWLPPYPETTGYIISTFLNWAGHREARGHTDQAESLRERARRMAHWLTTVQLECGALPAGTIGTEPTPTVFNTGQVIQGWCRAYREFGDEVLLASLVRAARWLESVQDADGCWRRSMSPLTVQTPATYNVRTASALFEAGLVTGERTFRDAATKNFDWALSQQRENGWFENNCLTDGDRPLTHTIGYTLEGLLDAAEMLKSERYLEAVLGASRPLMRAVRPDGFLSGRFNADWKPQVPWNCLTGSAQIALVWARLSKMTCDRFYLTASKRLLDFVGRAQVIAPPVSLNGLTAGIRGAIKGSHPIWGGYDPFRYPNWAAKFFIDALMAANED